MYINLINSTEPDAKDEATSPAEDDTVSSASILVSRQDVIDGQNTDTTISPDGQNTDTTIRPDGQGTDETVAEENGNNEGLISPDSTSVSLSLPRRLPLSTSTPLHCDVRDKPQSLKEKTQSLREVNGNTESSTVAESLTSIDVLSGGESDAGDTISKNNWNNSISSGLATAPRPLARAQLDPEYYVAKELLMTERSYKADLETLTVGWSTSVWPLPERSEAARPCLAVEEVVLSHGGLLARLDRALADRDSEEPEYRKVPELLHEHLKSTYDLYLRYIVESGSVVGRLEASRRKDPHVGRAAALHDLTHHLPLHAAVLRPLHRLHYYVHYAQHLILAFPTHWSKRVQTLVRVLSESATQQLEHTQNHVTLCQLQRDLLGYGKLLVAGREFLRLGCAYKHSNKGMQQRMLFLFSDILVICSKSSTGSQFRATCVLPVKHIQVQSSQLPHTFIVLYGDTSTMLSFSNEEDFLRWKQELTDAKDNAPQHEPDLTLDDTSHDAGVDETALSSSVTAVCWHRGTSVSREHLHLATTSQLSGYLLRKFKNSYGWQKLWVVFCMFTLYFYKSWHEQKPLASLPLLGYKVCVPTEEDGIKKDFVFKLQFKNHVYFFRADSQYTFNRWVETLQIASLQDYHNNNEQTQQ